MKNVIKKSTTENKKNRKIIIFHKKDDHLKTSTSQRLNDSYGLRKNRVGSRTPKILKARTFGHLFSRKWKFGRSFRHPWKSEGAPKINILSIDLCFCHKKWCFKNQYVPTAQWFVWFKEKQGRVQKRLCRKGSDFLTPFFAKMEIRGFISAPLEIRSGTPNQHFEHRSVFLT